MFILAALIIAAALSGSVAHAATINVGSNCTLANAIRSANQDTSVGGCTAGASGHDTIKMSGTITLTAALPQITSSMNIERSDGATSAIISGGGSHRIFSVGANGDLGIVNLTLRDGNAAKGGAIYSNESTGVVKVYSSVLQNHRATSDNGGAIYVNNGKLIVERSTLHSNRAAANGGAIYLGNSNRSDNIVNQAHMYSNRTTNGNGGAISIYKSKLQVLRSGLWSNSTASTNSDEKGGAIDVGSNGELVASDSTFDANSSSSGSTISSTDSGTQKLTLTHITLRATSTSTKSHALLQANSSTSVYLYNSILWNLSTGLTCTVATLSAQSKNLLNNNTGNCSTLSTNNPFGGSRTSGYIPLSSTSDAVDAADATHCTSTDQRGNTRPSGTACDVGAYEYKSTAAPPPPPSGTINVNSTCTLNNAIVSANSNTAVGGCTAGGTGIDTIVLQQNVTVTQSPQNIYSDITIDGGSKYYISGNNTLEELFTVNSGNYTFKLKNITVKEVKGQCTSTDSPSVIKSRAPVVIENSTISNNKDGSYVIEVVDAALTILNSTISDNDVGGTSCNISYDYALIEAGNSDLTIRSSTIKDNTLKTASRAPVGIWAGAFTRPVDIKITDSTFENNTDGSNGTGTGGALAVIGSYTTTVTIKGSTFKKNSYREGGSIFFGGSVSATIDRTAFRDNSARQSGGAIVNHGTLSVTNSNFTNNSAVGLNAGGAMSPPLPPLKHPTWSRSSRPASSTS